MMCKFLEKVYSFLCFAEMQIQNGFLQMKWKIQLMRKTGEKEFSMNYQKRQI